MRKQLASIFTAMAICLAMTTTGVTAADKLPPLGQGITIWFDTGGPVGGPYNTIVQNGAMQAASDLGADVKYLYSDWNPEKMVDNLKKSIADCAAMAQRKQFYQNPSTIKNHAETFCPKIKPRSRPES